MILRLAPDGTLHDRILAALRREIRAGRLRPGDRLPSTRDLARDLGVSRNVVVLAYEQLVLEGYVHSHVGAGTFVSERLPEDVLEACGAAARDDGDPPPRAPRLSAWGEITARFDPVGRDPGRRQGTHEIDFTYGRARPDARSGAAFAKALERAAERAGPHYPDPRGEPTLRAALAAWAHRHRGIQCDADRVIVTGGTQQAIDLAARLLVRRGDSVAMEEPGYQGARAIFQAVTDDVRAIPVDGDGMIVPRLPEDGSCRLVYVTPSHQFPTGAVLAAGCRYELLDWAKRHDAYVLEDDYDGEFRYDARPLEAVAALERDAPVLYCGTFAKTLFPALRLGYLVVPTELAPAFLGAKWLTDRGCPQVTQQALVELLESGEYARHLRRMARRYQESQGVLVRALRERLGDRVELQGGNAGAHLVVWLPGMDRERGEALVERCAERGVGVYPISPYYADPPEDRFGLILGYSLLTPAQIQEGVARLAQALTH